MFGLTIKRFVVLLLVVTIGHGAISPLASAHDGSHLVDNEQIPSTSDSTSSATSTSENQSSLLPILSLGGAILVGGVLLLLISRRKAD